MDIFKKKDQPKASSIKKKLLNFHPSNK